jgi:predicted metal-dependent phosphoesterase TrpH
MNKAIDLHMHTTYSDGSYSPEKLVELCHQSNLTHISITDHDTAGAYYPAKKHSESIGGPEIIPGIEFSAHHKGRDVHILAYYIPLNDAAFQKLCDKALENNRYRISLIAEKLQKLGFPISASDITPEHDSGVCMGPQIIKPLRNRGIILDENDGENFFKEYLSAGAPAYVPNSENPGEILDICRSAGAVTSIAHPHKIRDFSIVSDLIEMGAMGLEYYYPGVDSDDKEKLFDLAKKHELILTGGSDFHGKYSHTNLSDGCVPVEVLSEIQQMRESL